MLHVALAFRGGPNAEEELEVPSEWAGETLHGIAGVRAISDRSAILDTNSRAVRILRHVPDQNVVVSWGACWLPPTW